MKYKHGETGTAAGHWTRSVYFGDQYGFCLVNPNSSANTNRANLSWGVAPGFTV